MADLKLTDVAKTYGGTVEVLKNTNLDIKQGELIVFVGPSGYGKSRLLRMIAGLEKITGGELQIDGQVANDMPPAQRGIAMVFQSYALYPTMSVSRNISFGLEMRKVPKAEIEKTVAEVAQLLQIEHLLDRKPSQLSGGQRQRVAMGRALARSPRVFLFDEPLSNLDAKLRVEMRTEIKKLHKRLGTTIVYVTHDQVEAMTLADRIAVMKDGQVQQFGTPYEIYNNPANRFVADFMGSPPMNFLECVVLDDKLVIESQGQKFEIQVTHGERLKSAGLETVILGIRPEMITEPKPYAEGALVHNIPMQVEVTEPMGPDTIAFGQWNGTEIQARLSPEAGVEAQTKGHINVQVDTSKAVLFDAYSGARVDA